MFIKPPGPSQKKLIVLFYFRAATANFWALLNNLVWIFGKSLYQTTSTIFFSNSRSLERPGFIIETLDTVLMYTSIMIKVLFIDLFVQLGDLASDFAQGYFLILDEELFYYGICTFAIHWFPGIVASIHCISTKRAEYGVSKTLAWAGEY